MKLVFHSDQIEENTQIDEEMRKMIKGDNPRLAYIPSRSDETKKYFDIKRNWYKRFGITDFLYFDLDEEYVEEKIQELFSCDIIFLSGGDTFYFLKLINKRNFTTVLRDFVDKGGVIIGVSAGSILMTPSIKISSLLNEVPPDLSDYTAMGFVKFEFFPHLQKDRDGNLKKLKQYSLEKKSVIYACEDGDGIIVDGDNIKTIGKVVKIHNGEIIEGL